MLIGVVGAAVLAAVVFMVLAYRRDWRWTGLPADPGDGSPGAVARPSKTLWDWLQMLIVPLVLAVAAFGLNFAQTSRDRKREERDAATAQRAEARRAARDRAMAADRAHEQTLEAYLKEMADLMTRPGRATADTQTIAQTLTLVALRRLDGARRGLVVQFLDDAELLAGASPGAQQGLFISAGCGAGGHSCHRVGITIFLDHADLRDAVLPLALGPNTGAVDASGRPIPPATGDAHDPAWFDGADLRNSDFHGRRLFGVSFVGADLRGANFTGAELGYTSFNDSCLSGARFDRAEIDHADFGGAQGRDVNFSDSRLSKTRFARARLTDVGLAGASTPGVDWPRGWTATGIPMSDDAARDLCRREFR
jgi:uncharacterized protein YjbI with pentapeptide repeats